MSLKEKNSYWTRVVKDIERKARQQSRKERIKMYDFSVTLPEKLRKRVAKILPYEFDEYDKNVFIMESEAEAETPNVFDKAEGAEEAEEAEEGKDFNQKRNKDHEFNESTCSEIERLENEFPHFVLNVDKPTEHKVKEVKERHNWHSSYICKPRKERVKWDSKIYNMEHNIWEQTLDEQAEQLMDASAERFTEWINSLSSNRDSDMSKDALKALFSIEGDRKLLSSITTEPKEVKAIAKTVADKWNLPEMAIELKYENYIKDTLQKVPKKVNTVAFGRTIPVKDRPWIPDKTFKPIKTIYPQELLTFEKLFKGITHLRSTNELAKFYEKRPNLTKPAYLVSAGLFKQEAKAHTSTEIPLYERLKLNY